MSEMTVREAGRKGGSKVRDKYGKEFYQKIGKMGGTKGGARIRELIAKGKQAEAEEEKG